MATFVTVKKTIYAEYVRRISDVPRGRANRAPRERIELPDPADIPSDIESDVDESMDPAPVAVTSDSVSI
ncbi:hypothetical protein P3T76_010371 [Phytophthora citrophthora]|uniref:Uncharacterized protein n=1 Tax=Phytophthora citrophthora TaxID=4793 RepID=A0AAD9LGP4_9STRA|nr:hypothetical protein P3T76_010371 [Phytophthora citrophthora]